MTASNECEKQINSLKMDHHTADEYQQFLVRLEPLVGEEGE